MNNTESMNIVSTSKGSAFFVDLDKVIKEEIKKEKKISQEKQTNGTSLFIPLYDDKHKKKPSLRKRNDSMNRTFTKEDYERNALLGKMEPLLKQPTQPQSLKQTKNVQSVLEHNEIISPLLQAYASTALISKCSDKIKCPDDFDIDKQKLEKNEALLPKLPKWATGKNLSLDSTILDLHPFPEPKTEEARIEGTVTNTMEISNQGGDVKIQELFSSEKQHDKKYITAVLPSITRSCSAKSANNKMSPGFKRKKVTQTKKVSNVNKDATPAKSKTNKTVRKSQKKKGKVEKRSKRKDIKGGDGQTEVTDTNESSQMQSSGQIDQGYLSNEHSSLNQEMMGNKNNRSIEPIKDTFDAEILMSKDNAYDSILDFFDDNFETTVKATETPEQKTIQFTAMNSLEEKEKLNVLNNCPETLVESLEKSLSIDSVIDETTACSPRKKLQVFPHNNYLSKISEEQTRSLYSMKSKSSTTNNMEDVSSNNPEDSDGASFNNVFQEMSELIFRPGIVREITPSLQSGSIDEYFEDSSLSTGRPYLRSVLGNVSYRSVYSSSSSHASSVSEIIEWQKGKVIDRGAFGVVYQGLTNKAQLIAVKEVQIGNLKNADKNYRKLEDEINILKALSHRNIIKFIGTSLEENVVYIFMEYIAGGSLAGLISSFGPLKESIFQLYTRQIMSAVCYLHSEGVVHRDIKGGNILITVKGIIKLIDFGCAKELSLSLGSTVLLKSVKGTPYWMAPEVIQGTGCNHKSDIWSVGCTVMEMATGKPPWSEYTPYAAMYAIAENSSQPPSLSDKYSENARSFLKCCLTRDMHLRPSAEALLEHPFIIV